jgi:hypothetical protein
VTSDVRPCLILVSKGPPPALSKRLPLSLQPSEQKDLQRHSALLKMLKVLPLLPVLAAGALGGSFFGGSFLGGSFKHHRKVLRDKTR